MAQQDYDIAERFRQLEGSGLSRSIYAQAKARYILYKTEALKRNFAKFSITDGEVLELAIEYLAIGCELMENDKRKYACMAFDKGATLIEYANAKAYEKGERLLYKIVSSLSFHVASQYSKSYVVMDIKGNCVLPKLSNIVYWFLRRDYNRMSGEVARLFIDADNIGSDDDDECDVIYVREISRSLFLLVGYQQRNESILFKMGQERLKLVERIAKIRNDVDIWWIAKLLLLVSEEIKSSTLKAILDNYLDTNLPIAQGYINYSIFEKHQTELFLSQQKAITQILPSDKGGVVCLPTSGGKTKVAEFTILKTLIEGGRTLYLAPYRSLAFELENNFVDTFRSIGRTVTNLYGGATYSQVDSDQIKASDVIICTPEKAKAIFRYDNSIFDDIRLIIIDEGHLLGDNPRYIRNELFFEELKRKMSGHCKFVMLSAVLPNYNEISEWLTGNEENAVVSNWRPAESRFGIIDWQNDGIVNLEWYDGAKVSSFNRGFIVDENIEKKSDAFIATAISMLKNGSVLIYVQTTKEVFPNGKRLYERMGGYEDIEKKDKLHWEMFRLCCEEYYGKDSNIFKYAERGIFCHDAQLPSEVRLTEEHLLRTETPRVIVATSTLAQGVNLGVSTVIITGYGTTYNKQWTPMETSQFFNLSGRAGRSFTDFEGKVLVVLNKCNTDSKKKRSKKDIVERYFVGTNENAFSGCLMQLLKAFGKQLEMPTADFDLFLEQIAKDTWSDVEDASAEDGFDFFDDSILSLLEANKFDIEDAAWFDDFFEHSLMSLEIQKRLKDKELHDKIKGLLKARMIGLYNKSGKDQRKVRVMVTSSLPFRTELYLNDLIDDIGKTIDNYMNTNDIIDFLSSLLVSLKGVKELEIKNVKLENVLTIVPNWLKGEKIFHGKAKEDNITRNIVQNMFAYSLPWVLNGIARKFEDIGNEPYSEAITELASLVQIGVPSIEAVKVYKAGVKSRGCATEIASKMPMKNSSVDVIREQLIHMDKLPDGLSETSKEWVKIIKMSWKSSTKYTIEDKELDVESDKKRLFPVFVNAKTFLVDELMETIIPCEIDYKINSINGLCFNKVEKGKYQLDVLNPKYHIRGKRK